MSNPIYITPGDVQIVSLDIINDAGRRSIMGQFLSIDIYEDIDECSLHAEIKLLDAVNLIKQVPILGVEEVEVSYCSSGSEDIITHKFRLFSISPVTDTSNNRGSLYTLYCTTPEHITNSIRVLDVSYKDNIHNIVKSILKSELHSSKNFYFDKTVGIIKIKIF